MTKLFSPIRWWRALCLFLYFLKEVFVANLQVARLVVFEENDNIRPGILKMPLKVESDLEIFLLTTMITLTPGTLSLSVTPDRKELFFHVIHSTDMEGTIRSIQDGFEKRILEVLR